MRPNATAAFIALCFVLVAGLAGGLLLSLRGIDTGVYWGGLVTLITLLINLVRTEQTRQEVNSVAERVDQVVKQTNGANTRLQRAALTALAELPPERAKEVLRNSGVTQRPNETMTTRPDDTRPDERTPLE